MTSKPKPITHSESKSPSTSPRTSHLHTGTPIFKREEEESTTIAQTHHTLERLSRESPEVQSLIQKLQGFSISTQGSETSQFNLPHPLTRLQSRSSVLNLLSCLYPRGKGKKKH